MTGFYTDRIAGFIAETRFEDLPPEVVHQAKLLILDVIGCAVSGSSHDRGAISRKVVKSFGGNPESTILGDGTRVSCIGAAYANSNMASALDNEETFMLEHLSSNTFFSALALAEREHASGADLIRATVIGYEVAARLILSTGFMGKIQDGKVVRYQVVGNPISMGSVAAACSVLKLTKGKTVNALGVGGHYAPTPSKHLWSMSSDLPLIKYWDSGWMALGGVMSALMANEGYTSYSVGILDGDSGFWRMYGAESCDFDIIVNKLGSKWWIMDAAFKPWPSCRLTHQALTAFSRIIQKYDLRPEEVDEVVVKGSFMWLPHFQNQNPAGATNLQFSGSHSLAMVMFKIPPSVDWQRPEIADKPAIKEFRKKVRLEPDPKIVSAQIGRQLSQAPRVIREIPTTVQVSARGRTFSETVRYAKGDPWDPEFRMSDGELKEKFRLNASSLLPASLEWRKKIEDIGEMCLNLEQLQDVNDLTRLMTVP